MKGGGGGTLEAEAQGWEAVGGEGDGVETDEVQLCRLSEGDVGRGLLLQLSQTQMTAPAPCDKHTSEVQRCCCGATWISPSFHRLLEDIKTPHAGPVICGSEGFDK